MRSKLLYAIMFCGALAGCVRENNISATQPQTQIPPGMVACQGPAVPLAPIFQSMPNKITCRFDTGYETGWNNNRLKIDPPRTTQASVELVFNDFSLSGSPKLAKGRKNDAKSGNYFLFPSGDVTFLPVSGETGSLPDIVTIFPQQEKKGHYAAVLSQHQSLKDNFKASQYYGSCLPEGRQ